MGAAFVLILANPTVKHFFGLDVPPDHRHAGGHRHRGARRCRDRIGLATVSLGSKVLSAVSIVRLPVSAPGLTSEQARQLLAEHGPNLIIPEHRRASVLTWVRRALTDPMVVLLIFAGVIYVAIGSVQNAAIVAVAAVPIALLGILLEMRSERALESLRALTAPIAKVIRDGAILGVPARELVPGDVVFVEEGGIPPADGVLVEAANLLLDESALTGESQPVSKQPGEPLLAGTTVLAGRGYAVLTITGLETEYGRVGRLVAQIKQPPTPLERLIRRLMLWLGAVALGFCVVVAGTELVRGHGWGPALIAGVSLAIAAIPEELPVVYTLYLALGAWRLARQKALVRRLPGVEALGAASVICTDKTGTVTMGRMTVSAARTPVGPDGEAGLLEAALLACEPQPFDPLETAIVKFAVENGVDSKRLQAGTLVRDYPFDPLDKYMSHVWRAVSGNHIVAKGALEGILEHARTDRVTRAWADAENRRLATAGMRVLAVAAGSLPSLGLDRAADERALRFIGLIGFADPLRPGVVEAVRECREAGIRVVMITGDHPLTASSIAAAMGLGPDVAVATGVELDAADDDALSRIVARTDIFARIRPEQKYRLVRALRATGQVVAMTGDGINDAPALREADIGVAMGERGTEVAREAATLVLLDDNFATIVNAVRNGRRIFRNLQRAFAYLIAFHVPLLLTAAAIPLLGLPLLLLPIHLILLELFLHPAISLVFQAEPAPPALMREPPRRLRAGLVPLPVAIRTTTAGFVLFIGVLVLYWWRLSAGDGEAGARTVAFIALLLGQLLLLLIERSAPHLVMAIPRWIDRTTALLMMAVLSVIAVMTYIPPLAAILRMEPPSLAGWGLAVGTAVLCTIWQEMLKFRSRSVQLLGG